MDLYSANGFIDGQPQTWVLNDGIQRRYLKKNPTMEDAYRFASFKLKAMYIGANTAAVSKLEEVNKEISSLLFQTTTGTAGLVVLDKVDDSLKRDIEKLKNECIERYSEYLNAVSTGMEFDDLPAMIPDAKSGSCWKIWYLSVFSKVQNQSFDEDASI